tara:strand:- start:411 stop:1037 length:627 start_codon:yes stop_codon:yes gene_type:complete
MNKIITLLMIFSATLSAQDETARNILNKLSETHKLYNNITVNFDLNYENKNLNIKEKQSGILVISGDKFLLDIDDQIIINNGEIQWIYLADMNEVQIINHEEENNIMNPKNFFNFYERISKYRYIGVKSEDKTRLHIIELFPEESSMFMKVELTVNSEKNQLKNIILFDKSGGTYTYLITSFISNSKETPQFIFNTEDYPDIDVIDLR